MARGSKPTFEDKETRDRAVLAAAVKSGGLEYANKLNRLLKQAGDSNLRVDVPTNAAGSIVLSNALGTKFLQSEAGVLADLSGGKIRFIGPDGKEINTERTVTVQVIENGAGVRTLGIDGVLRPVRGKAIITEEQRQSILQNTPVATQPANSKAGTGLPGGPISGTYIVPSGSFNLPKGNVLDQITSRAPLTLADINAMFTVKGKGDKA